MTKIDISPIFQLDQLELICNYIVKSSNSRRCLPASTLRYLTITPNCNFGPIFSIYVGDIHKDLRRGIVFYSRGWGWRLRIGWREVLAEKRRQLESESDDDDDDDLSILRVWSTCKTCGGEFGDGWTSCLCDDKPDFD